MTINEACVTTLEKFQTHILNDLGGEPGAPFYHICVAHERRLAGTYDLATHQGSIEQTAADFNMLPTALVEDLVDWVATW